MKTLIVIALLLIGYSALLYVIYSVYSLFKGRFGEFGPYMPSVGKSKKTMLDIARKYLAESPKPLTVIDLGSGTGSLLIPLAKEFPQHRFVGLEWDKIPLLVSKIRSARLKNTEWRQQNFMEYSCADCDIIFCYLLKTMQEKIGVKLANEIKKDCHVITELYPVNHLQLIETYNKPKHGLGVPVYLMRK